MIKRSNLLAWLLMAIFLVFLSCKSAVVREGGSITLLDKPVPNHDINRDSCFAEAYCERRFRYFDFDTTIYLDQKFSDSPYILEECLQCSLFRLVIKNDTVDNVRTNTSTDTSHEYLIVYDSGKKKVVSVDVRFLSE